MPHALEQRIKEARVQLDKQDVDYEATLATKLAIAQDLFNQHGAADLEVRMPLPAACCQLKPRLTIAFRMLAS